MSPYLSHYAAMYHSLQSGVRHFWQNEATTGGLPLQDSSLHSAKLEIVQFL